MQHLLGSLGSETARERYIYYWISRETGRETSTAGPVERETVVVRN